MFLKLFLHVCACNAHWAGILLRYARCLPGSWDVFIANRDCSKVLEHSKWWQYTCRQVFSMDLVLLVVENACDHTTSWLASLAQKALTYFEAALICWLTVLCIRVRKRAPEIWFMGGKLAQNLPSRDVVLGPPDRLLFLMKSINALSSTSPCCYFCY